MSNNDNNYDNQKYLNYLYERYQLDTEQIKRVTKYQLSNIKINNLKVLDSKFSYKVICSYYSKYATKKFKGIYKEELLNLINVSGQINTLEFYHQLAILPKLRITETRYNNILNNLNLDVSLTGIEVNNLNLLVPHRDSYYFASRCGRRILARLSPAEIRANKINQSHLKLMGLLN